MTLNQISEMLHWFCMISWYLPSWAVEKQFRHLTEMKIKINDISVEGFVSYF